MDIGEKIPDLKIKLLDGSETSFQELVENGPLLVDFWATWCEPCKKIMKFHNQYHQDYYEKGFKVLMINMERWSALVKVNSYLNRKDLQFHIGLDQNNQLYNRLTMKQMLTVILIAKGGEINWIKKGYLPSDEIEIKKQIELLLENNIE